MHSPHERMGIVLADNCEECARRSRDLEGLAALDDGNLRKLADLAAAVAVGGGARPAGASWADMRAVYTLRLAGRIVFLSELTEAAAR